MGAGCSTANAVVQRENGAVSARSGHHTSRSGGGLSARSKEVVVKSVMAYIPYAVSQFYVAKPKEVIGASMDLFPAALFFADVSSFSFLLEKLSHTKDLAGGSERLTYLMNGFLGDIVDTILSHGGDIIQFAGDAFLAVWKVPVAEKKAVDAASNQKALTEAILQAAFCAQEVQKVISNSEVFDGFETINLRMRIQIGAGDVAGLHFGGDDRRSYMVVGAAVDATFKADKFNTPGNIVLTKHAYDFAKIFCTVAKHEDAEIYELKALLKEVVAKKKPPFATLPDKKLLAPYVPSNVLGFLEVHQIEWLAEVRHVTMIFVLLPAPKSTTLNEAYSSYMQSTLSDVVRIVSQFDGMLAHLSSDDKGIFAVIVFGIPSHENDPIRAVSTAVEINKSFVARKAISQIGVATGVAVACSVGSKSRCQYTLYGGTVNFAARLMTSCVPVGVGILCDEATSLAAKSRFSFRPLDPIELKGIGKVPVFVPEILVSWNAVTQANASRGTNAQGELVGRDDEMLLFYRVKKRMLETKKSGCVIVESEPGLGRSALMSSFMANATSSGFTILFGEADSIELGGPFLIYRNVLKGLLKFNPRDSPQERRDKVENLVSLKYLPLISLLNTILPFNFPETDETRWLNGGAKTDLLVTMVSALLQKTALQQPTMLALQEAQWMDSASWQLTHTIIQSVHPCLVVIGTRTIPKPPPINYAKLLMEPGVRHMVLKPLGEQEMIEIIRSQLEITTDPPQNLITYLQETASGNLFFTLALLQELKTEGVITVANGVAKFSGGGSNAGSTVVPRNMQSLITSKLDVLDPDTQMFLKIAAVLGKSFLWEAAIGLLTDGKRKTELLKSRLEILESAQLLAKQEPDEREAAFQGKGTMQFRTAAIQQIVYSAMVSKQTEQIHLQAAEWYQTKFSEQSEMESVYSTIYHHYEKANRPDSALQFCIKAAFFFALNKFLRGSNQALHQCHHLSHI